MLRLLQDWQSQGNLYLVKDCQSVQNDLYAFFKFLRFHLFLSLCYLFLFYHFILSFHFEMYTYVFFYHSIVTFHSKSSHFYSFVSSWRSEISESGFRCISFNSHTQMVSDNPSEPFAFPAYFRYDLILRYSFVFHLVLFG